MALTRSPSIESLPENIVVEIFHYLSTKDLCRIARVCSQWRRIANDKTLWKHVDLSDYKINLPNMWKLMRAHFSEAVLTVKMRGFLDSGPKKKKPSFSEAALKDMRERCPNVRELHIILSNLEDVNLKRSPLPSSLTLLNLSKCIFPAEWYPEIVSQLPKLTHLILQGCKVNNTHLKEICKAKTLKSLDLHGCYRINDDGINTVAKSLPNLEELIITGCIYSDEGLHHVSCNLKKLKLFKGNSESENFLLFCKQH
ncbi:F-box/LRR-repeat protein 12 [Lingula anatina]|uniref:F-box/LRR-repeat protein 12 n=1 Tax=Lingula anatina TaxID=7574 RepID=A0A1S3HGL9_LINAN|nr:F-box/LRR-repeat protein 12 [Lingula anatina]|eukprot:XP_013385202.1 F-box/LRR-repeat protein 12 [Lingula anatina]